MKTILIGYGLSGMVFHAPLLQAAQFDITAIVLNNIDRRQQAKSDFPDAVICRNIDEALQQSDAPLVVIASPNDTHAGLAIKAFQAHRHVVVDKPVALNVAEYKNMMDAAVLAGKYLIPFQNRRWDADFLSLKQLIANQTLGEIVKFEARFDRYNPMVKDRWRERDVSGGGILFDLGPHLIDQAVQLFGAPDWVFCRLLSQRIGAQTHDAFEMILGRDQDLHYPYITLGASPFSAAADQPHGAPRFKVQGRKATWLKSGFDPQEAVLRTRLSSGELPNQIEGITESPDARGRLIEGATGDVTLTAAGVGGWGTFYPQVRQAIEQLMPPPVLTRDGLVTCAVIDAARLSAGSRSVQAVKINE